MPMLAARLAEMAGDDAAKVRDESSLYKLMSGESTSTPILPEILLALGTSPDRFADQEELARRLLDLFHTMWKIDPEYARDFVGHARHLVDGLQRESPAVPLSGHESSAGSGRPAKG